MKASNKTYQRLMLLGHTLCSLVNFLKFFLIQVVQRFWIRIVVFVLGLLTCSFLVINLFWQSLDSNVRVLDQFLISNTILTNLSCLVNWSNTNVCYINILLRLSKNIRRFLSRVVWVFFDL